MGESREKRGSMALAAVLSSMDRGDGSNAPALMAGAERRGECGVVRESRGSGAVASRSRDGFL